jgi:hypothetical protein
MPAKPAAMLVVPSAEAPMRRSFPLLVLLVLVGCAGASDAPPASTAPPPAPPPTSTAPGPTLPAPGVRVSSPACGYGGSAPAVSVFVDVDTDIALTGVTLSFTLADSATGAPRGASRAPETLVVSPIERGLLDFSTQGTTPFDGTIAAGTRTRLMYFAGLGEDPSAAGLPPSAFGGPLRVNVVLRTNEGVFAATCDTAGMWPSS